MGNEFCNVLYVCTFHREIETKDQSVGWPFACKSVLCHNYVKLTGSNLCIALLAYCEVISFSEKGLEKKLRAEAGETFLQYSRWYSYVRTYMCINNDLYFPMSIRNKPLQNSIQQILYLPIPACSQENSVNPSTAAN